VSDKALSDMPVVGLGSMETDLFAASHGKRVSVVILRFQASANRAIRDLRR